MLIEWYSIIKDEFCCTRASIIYVCDNKVANDSENRIQYHRTPKPNMYVIYFVCASKNGCWGKNYFKNYVAKQTGVKRCHGDEANFPSLTFIKQT